MCTGVFLHSVDSPIPMDLNCETRLSRSPRFRILIDSFKSRPNENSWKNSFIGRFKSKLKIEALSSKIKVTLRSVDNRRRVNDQMSFESFEKVGKILEEKNV